MTDYSNADDFDTTVPESSLTTFYCNGLKNERVLLEFPEFRHLCPVSERPDHGTVIVEYVSDGDIIEEKSLRDYFYSWSDCKVWHEKAIAEIADTISNAIDSSEITVKATFEPRGNITTTVISER